MNWLPLLNILGLVLGAVGALVVLIPGLKKTRNIDDDFIVDMDRETGDYTQKKHLAERKLNTIAFGLIFFGFFLQLVAATISYS